MINIIIGFILITLGITGVALNWYVFLDLLSSFGPMFLLIIGMVCFIGGMSRYFKNKDA